MRCNAFFDGRRLTMRHRTTPKNRNMKKLSLSAAIALLTIGQGYGQYTSFNNFDGKTQQLCVRDIVQSADGTMWLAAENGLYSFDGYYVLPHTSPFPFRAKCSTFSPLSKKYNTFFILCQCNKVFWAM